MPLFIFIPVCFLALVALAITFAENSKKRCHKFWVWFFFGAVLFLGIFIMQLEYARNLK